MSTDLTIFTDNGFATAMKIAETLVKSGVLPRGIDNPFKAFAIIQKGREIGVGPMRALTGINLIEGKPTVSPELKLEQFRQRGGKVQWIKSDNTIAHLKLTAANGDVHEEIVTLEDMKVAGVAHKDNWRKYPKSMLRARATGFGLRALGEGDGSYTPDELGAVTNEAGEIEYQPPVHADASPSNTRSTGSTSPAASAPVSVATPATSHKPRTAADIKHNGVFATKAQIAKLHILQPQITTLWRCAEDKECDDKRPCGYHGKLRVYRGQDGLRCRSSSQLSSDQIGYFLDWCEKTIATRTITEPLDIGGHAGVVPEHDELHEDIDGAEDRARFRSEMEGDDGPKGVVGAAATPVSSNASPPKSSQTGTSETKPDTGIAPTPDALLAVKNLIKGLGWKIGFTRIWFAERWPDLVCTSKDVDGILGQLTARQADSTYLLLSAHGRPPYEGLLADMRARGEVAS